MPEYTENFNKKMKLWQLRFSMLKQTKTQNWTEKEITEALKSLKNNKTRDPCGFINELFKPSVIGNDLKLSVVDLFNGIKTNYFVPPTLDMANITTIFKKKGSKFDLENDR